MAKRKEIEVVCYLMMADGSAKLMSELTDEERETWHSNLMHRLSQNMNGYFARHPEEYAKVKDLSETIDKASGDA